MKAISGKEFVNLLERRDWKLKRIKGNHHIYMKEDSTIRISVPIHGKQAIKTRSSQAF